MLIFCGLSFVLSGLVILSYFGLEIVDLAREIRFAREHHFDTHKPDLIYVRSWMSIRYISDVYGIPESTLFTEIGIPMTPKNSVLPLKLLRDASQSALESFLQKLLQAIKIHYPSSPQ